MSSLIKAGLNRYINSVMFWISFIAVGFIAKLTREETELLGFNESRIYTVFIIYAVLLAWSIGREYEEGIFRNKLVAGHTKTKIFFSEMILGNIICGILFFLFAIVFVSKYWFVIKLIPVMASVKVCVNFMLINITAVSIIVTISMLLSHRGISIIMNIVFILGSAMCIYEVADILSQPKYTTVYEIEYYEVVDEIGIVHTEERIVEGSEREVFNPSYVDGVKRAAYQFVYNAMPAGQINENLYYLMMYWDYHMYNYYYLPAIANGEYDNNYISKEDDSKLNVNILFSIGMITSLNLIGFATFKKVEFK